MVEWRVFRRLFTEMVRGPEEDVDLALASLYLAGEEYPELQVGAYMATLDSIGEATGKAVPREKSARAQLEALSYHFAQVEGFHGDIEERSDPRNSYINEVIDRRKGAPISLCILYKEIAARNEILVEGIGLPGRFILKYTGTEEGIFIDPFNEGTLMSRTDCEEMVRRRYEGRVPFRDAYLYPYDKKQMLVRLLTSLKVAYFESEDYARSLAAADRIAIVDPALDVNIRERARLYYLMGQYREAIRSFELYLRLFPDAKDKEEVEKQIHGLWTLISHLS